MIQEKPVRMIKEESELRAPASCDSWGHYWQYISPLSPPIGFFVPIATAAAPKTRPKHHHGELPDCQLSDVIAQTPTTGGK